MSAIRRALHVAPVLVLVLLSACGNSSFNLSDVTIDLAAAGDTGGAVVVAGQGVSAARAQGMLADADANVTASNAAGSLHVVLYYVAADPASDSSCTQVAAAGSGPTGYFLCLATDPNLETMGGYVLPQGTPVTANFLIDSRFWLGVQLVGATSSNATVSFTGMVGHLLYY